MKIIFINQYYWPDESGTAQILTDLAESLAGKGAKIEIFTSKYSYVNRRYRFIKKEERNKVRIYRLFSTRLKHFGIIGRLIDGVVFSIMSLLRLLVRANDSYILVPMMDPPMLGIVFDLLKLKKRIPIIYWCQDIYPEIFLASVKHQKTPWIENLLIKARNHVWNQSNAVVVLSTDMKKYFKEKCKMDCNVVEISNWADGRRVYSVEEEMNPLKNAWEIDDEFIVGYSGNLGRVHDYKTILEAAEILSGHLGIRFLLSGNGWGMQRFKREIPQNLKRLFIFKSYQPRDELKNVLSLSHIHWVSLKPEFNDFLFPSKFYSIIAVGRPVLLIGDDKTEIARIVAENEIGFVISNGDYKMLGEKILFLKKYRDIRIEMGKRARTLFEKKYDLSVALHHWEELLDDLHSDNFG